MECNSCGKICERKELDDDGKCLICSSDIKEATLFREQFRSAFLAGRGKQQLASLLESGKFFEMIDSETDRAIHNDRLSWVLLIVGPNKTKELYKRFVDVIFELA